MEPWGLMPHSQGLSNNPEPNQPNFLLWVLSIDTYLFKVHSNIVPPSTPRNNNNNNPLILQPTENQPCQQTCGFTSTWPQRWNIIQLRLHIPYGQHDEYPGHCLLSRPRLQLQISKAGLAPVAYTALVGIEPAPHPTIRVWKDMP